MNIFYKYAAEYKVLRNKSQHHITILTLLFWVWKPLKKPKMGKTGAAVRYRFYYEKIGNITITTNSLNPGEHSNLTESLGKSQQNPSNPVHECTTSCTVSHMCGRSYSGPYTHARGSWGLAGIRPMILLRSCVCQVWVNLQ